MHSATHQNGHVVNDRSSDSTFNGEASPPARDQLEPIAVIGLSLRFPQDAASVEGFWKLLTAGRSAMTEVPKDRFNVNAFYHPDASRTDAVCIHDSLEMCTCHSPGKLSY